MIVPLIRLKIIALLVLIPVAASAQSSRQSIPERVAAVRAQEERLILIGERLAVAAAPWCEDSWSLGWVLGDMGQYPKAVRLSVRNTWGTHASTNLFVAAVAPGGAAAEAGLTPGTAITAINGNMPMRHAGDSASRHALANNERVIADALRANGGRVSLSLLEADGDRRTITVAARDACASRFELGVDLEKQAYADGSVVQVTLGMAQFTTDAELAAVIAHELAHNMLRHRLRSDARGIPANYTRYLGVNARVVRGLEEEADRLSVWLLQQAGYDPEAPIAFWHRFGPDNDTPHPFGRLHDPWRVRVEHLRDELALMRRERAQNPEAVPALLDVIREAEAADAAGTRSDVTEEQSARSTGQN
jgi:beta-barrel assembly-enhancing protease